MEVYQRKTHGSFLIVALIVLLVLTVVVGIAQYLAVETMRRERAVAVYEDRLHRADGLVQRLVSRLKKRPPVNPNDLQNPTDSTSEIGTWDSRPYELGWKRERVPAAFLMYRYVVWIRFPEDLPARTYRYQLRVQAPAHLSPRVVRIEDVAMDALDPTSAGDRDAGFLRARPPDAERRLREASKEAWTERLATTALADATADQVRAAAAAPIAPDSAQLVPYLEAQEVFEANAVLAERVQRARAAAAAAQALPAAWRRWHDFARFQLAGALIQNAAAQVPALRQQEFQEALSLVQQVLNPQGACCGEAKAAWRRAYLRMCLRNDPASASELTSTRQSAAAELGDVLGSTGFFHRFTDTLRPEVVPYFERLWRARVAASVKIRPDAYALVSALEDRSSPIVHMETPTPLDPVDWTRDGGSLVVADRLLFDPAVWRYQDFATIWKLDLEGLQLTNLMPTINGFPPQAGRPGAYHVTNAQLAPDGQLLMTTGFDLLGPPSGQWPNGQYFLCVMRGALRGCVSEFAVTTGPWVVPAVFSPNADYLLVAGDQPAPNGLHLYSLAEAAQGVYSYVRGVGYTGALGTQRPALLGRLPQWPAGTIASGLSWVENWIAVTVAEPGETKVAFFPFQGYPLAGEVTPTIAGGFAGQSLLANYVQHPRLGQLVRQPPGYLVSEGSGLRLVPLPGGPAATPPRWPVNPELALSEIGDVRVPPWGRVAFFTARDNGSPFRTYALSLITGRATALVGGADSIIPGVEEVGRIVVSPVPDPLVP